MRGGPKLARRNGVAADFGLRAAFLRDREGHTDSCSIRLPDSRRSRANSIAGDPTMPSGPKLPAGVRVPSDSSVGCPNLPGTHHALGCCPRRVPACSWRAEQARQQPSTSTVVFDRPPFRCVEGAKQVVPVTSHDSQWLEALRWRERARGGVALAPERKGCSCSASTPVGCQTGK